MLDVPEWCTMEPEERSEGRVEGESELKVGALGIRSSSSSTKRGAPKYGQQEK